MPSYGKIIGVLLILAAVGAIVWGIVHLVNMGKELGQAQTEIADLKTRNSQLEKSAQNVADVDKRATECITNLATVTAERDLWGRERTEFMLQAAALRNKPTPTRPVIPADSTLEQAVTIARQWEADHVR